MLIAASTPSQGCFWPPPSPPNKRSEFSRSSTISAAAVAQLQREFEFSTATLASLSLTAVQSNTKNTVITHEKRDYGKMVPIHLNSVLT